VIPGLDKLIDTILGTALSQAQNKIRRSETVIALLKRFNLDPDHPPTDFTAIYQYALVEYGVGKPKPVLDLFRRQEIHQTFRQAFEQNNFPLLERVSHEAIEAYAFGDEIRQLGIDLRRELVAFSAVFIGVAKRSRTPAEVLQDQQARSLHQHLFALQERLDRLPTIEGIRTEMARLAGEEILALPAAEQDNRWAQQCRAYALSQQMRGWFETLGFRFEPYEVWEADYFEWIINIPVRRGRYDRILVRGIDGEAGLPDVSALRQAVDQQRTDEGWLVTARRISRAARDEVEKNENDNLGCYTLDELLDQDADFSGYLDWLEQEIGRRKIDQTYVPLACTKEEFDYVTKQRIGMSHYDERDGWIDGYIDLWLDDPAKEHISVLGEFGTGKTWFALHYAWQALQRYKEAKRRGLERPRLPLVIPLRDYAKAVSVESLFSEFFFRKYEIPIPGYSVFEQLNRMGKLLLIFDGFDEMAARVDRQEMINNFWELAKVVVPGAKVILTCRTEHFPEATEGRALLNAELQASTQSLTGETPQFEVLELEKFSDDQIRQVLSSQTQPATVEQVMGNPQLLDLARRPVMTELILEALPDIEAGKPIDMSRIYLYAVRRKMERDIKAERTFTSMAEKLYFLCELSWEMLSTDRMSINYREFPDRIRRLFGASVQEEKDLDHWHYDMMGQTMLIRNAAGDYMPAHRSLLEFFVAYKFAAELGALTPDFTELVKAEFCLDNAALPQTHTWSTYFQYQLDATERSIAIPPLETFTPESLERLRQTVGQSPFTKAVVDLLLPMIAFLQDQDSPLHHVLGMTRHKTNEEVGYLGGNVATLLVKLDETSLVERNLDHTVVIGADFTDATLCDTSFVEANLAESKFPKILGAVFSVAYSPDGKLIAIGDASGEIRVWNAREGRAILSCVGHTDWVRSVAFDRTSKRLVSASFDYSVRVWDAHKGKCLKILEEHTNRVNSVAISPDGSLIASGSDDGTTKIWDSYSGECLRTLQGDDQTVESVVFSPKNEVIVTCSSNKMIRFWTIAGELIRTIEGHTKLIRSLAISSDGLLLASGGHDKTIKLWNIDTGEYLASLSGHESRICTLALNPNASLLASGSFDRTIKIWDVQTKTCLKTLVGHTEWVRAVAFSPNGKTLISGSDDQTVRVWNVATGESLSVLQGYISAVRSIAVSPDGAILVSSSEDAKLKLWNLKTGDSLQTLHGHRSRINSVAINPDGKILASGSYDTSIKFWDIATGECCRTLKGHTRTVNSVAFSHDGQTLVTGSADCTIRLWDVATGSCLRVIEEEDSSWLWSIAISPDDLFIASGNDDKTARLWSLETGECLKILEGHLSSVNAVAFSPNSKLLATASGGTDRIIRIWDVVSGLCVNALHGNSNWPLEIVFSANGQNLISSDDTTIKIWDVNRGNCVKTIQGHTDRIRAITITPDERTIVSGGFDGTIKLWDANTCECIRTIQDKRPYEGMNITSVKGLTEAEKVTLKALGAIEN
jgi:predicted NACHT family NTPase